MFNEMQTVLVQFKRSVGISLPAFVLEANLPPTADGKERPTSKNLIERKGVVPLAIPTVLARANLRLADVRSRIRVNSVGKSTRLLTFTFATAAPNSEPRQELESTRAEFLESLLKKRWDEARVVELTASRRFGWSSSRTKSLTRYGRETSPTNWRVPLASR